MAFKTLGIRKIEYEINQSTESMILGESGSELQKIGIGSVCIFQISCSSSEFVIKRLSLLSGKVRAAPLIFQFDSGIYRKPYLPVYYDIEHILYIVN